MALKVKYFIKNMIITNNLQDNCRGSLVGGAIGDALGYAVEFFSWHTIKNRYGESGITEYDLDKNGVAEFSDDTQMSLFTAEGLLQSISREKTDLRDIGSSIRAAYEHWYATQSRLPHALSNSWLTNVSSLWSERAPGMTCMSALHQISYGGGSPVSNDSKGCGGVMRVAPIGIFAATHPSILDLENAGNLARYAAEITHTHPLSSYSSMALAMLIAEIMTYEEIDRDQFRYVIIDRVFKSLGKRYPKDNDLANLFNLILKAMALADLKRADSECIRELGQGWVAEETLAIAVFSVMRYIDNFEKCIICSVNHSGDSDSTGAVTGNLIGAILGYDAIPEKFKTNLELHDLLVSVADDLAGTSSEEQKRERYVFHRPFNVDESDIL